MSDDDDVAAAIETLVEDPLGEGVEPVSSGGAWLKRQGRFHALSKGFRELFSEIEQAARD